MSIDACCDRGVESVTYRTQHKTLIKAHQKETTVYPDGQSLTESLDSVINQLVNSKETLRRRENAEKKRDEEGAEKRQKKHPNGDDRKYMDTNNREAYDYGFVGLTAENSDGFYYNLNRNCTDGNTNYGKKQSQNERDVLRREEKEKKLSKEKRNSGERRESREKIAEHSSRNVDANFVENGNEKYGKQGNPLPTWKRQGQSSREKEESINRGYDFARIADEWNTYYAAQDNAENERKQRSILKKESALDKPVCGAVEVEEWATRTIRFLLKTHRSMKNLQFCVGPLFQGDEYLDQLESMHRHLKMFNTQFKILKKKTEEILADGHFDEESNGIRFEKTGKKNDIHQRFPNEERRG